MHSNFDEQYEKYLEDNEPEVIAEFEVDGSLVTLYGPVVAVHGFENELYAAEGVWCEKDEETGEFMPDWSLSWFWRADENPENYVYFEQDGIPVSLHNMTHMIDDAVVATLEILEDQPTYLEAEG